MTFKNSIVKYIISGYRKDRVEQGRKGITEKNFIISLLSTQDQTNLH